MVSTIVFTEIKPEIRNLNKINHNRIEYTIFNNSSGYSEFHILEKKDNKWEHYSRDSWENVWYKTDLDDIARKVFEV